MCSSDAIQLVLSSQPSAKAAHSLLFLRFLAFLQGNNAFELFPGPFDVYKAPAYRCTLLSTFLLGQYADIVSPKYPPRRDLTPANMSQK